MCLYLFKINFITPLFVAQPISTYLKTIGRVDGIAVVAAIAAVLARADLHCGCQSPLQVAGIRHRKRDVEFSEIHRREREQPR